MKIILPEEETNALETMIRSGANGVKVLDRIFKESIEDLKNIKNIDPKSNMGLQTLARQLACEIVEDIQKLIFSPGVENKNEPPVEGRRYR